MEKARLAWAAFDLTLWKFANLQIVAENDPILLETQTVKKTLATIDMIFLGREQPLLVFLMLNTFWNLNQKR